MRESDRNHHRRTETSIHRSRKNIPIAAAGFFLVWVLASLFVHPLPHQVSESPAELFKGAEMEPAAMDVFKRACINCHSEKTQWPWYSEVAPVSWVVENDVKRARTRMNISRWDTLSTTDRRVLLTAIGIVIENREMPPARYLVLHPEAKLSPDELVEVIEWTRTERHRLREFGH